MGIRCVEGWDRVLMNFVLLSCLSRIRFRVLFPRCFLPADELTSFEDSRGFSPEKFILTEVVYERYHFNFYSALYPDHLFFGADFSKPDTLRDGSRFGFQEPSSA